MHDLASPILDYKQPLPVVILHLLKCQFSWLFRGTLNSLVLVVFVRRDIIVVIIIHRCVQTVLCLFRHYRGLINCRESSFGSLGSAWLLLKHTEYVISSL